MPAAVRARRAHRRPAPSVCIRAEPNARPGLGLSARISAIMSAMSSSSTPQSLRSAAMSRLASRSRCATSACIAGIEAVELAELDAPGIRSRLRAQMPGGSNVCSTASTASTSACVAPSRSATWPRSARQVAGLVDEIDQVLADHALRRVGEGDRELLGEMVARASSRRRRRLRDCSRSSLEAPPPHSV